MESSYNPMMCNVVTGAIRKKITVRHEKSQGATAVIQVRAFIGFNWKIMCLKIQMSVTKHTAGNMEHQEEHG